MVYIQIERTWSSKKVGYGVLEISHRSRVREGFLEEGALGLGLRMDQMEPRDRWEGGKVFQAQPEQRP